MLRRQNSPAADPSIDPVAHSGRGTLEREDNDGLVSSRVGVISVNRARRWDNAPLHEEKNDLVGGAQRVNVHARSGNDDSQHEEEDELDGGTFDCVGMGEEAPPARILPTLALVGAIAFLAWAWRVDKRGARG